MKLVVGLGNPEKKYELTRHNVGFCAVDALTDYLIHEGGAEIITREKTKQCERTRLRITDQDSGVSETIDCVKPLTYMNRSGECVRVLCDIGTDLIVIHDDIDLPFGSVRIDWNKSSAGHRGVQNIIDHLKTKGFTRIRIGIRSAALEKGETETYVLKRFSKSEQEALKPLFRRCADAFLVLLSRGLPAAQNSLHSLGTKKTARGREVL